MANPPTQGLIPLHFCSTSLMPKQHGKKMKCSTWSHSSAGAAPSISVSREVEDSGTEGMHSTHRDSMTKAGITGCHLAQTHLGNGVDWSSLGTDVVEQDHSSEGLQSPSQSSLTVPASEAVPRVRPHPSVGLTSCPKAAFEPACIPFLSCFLSREVWGDAT